MCVVSNMGDAFNQRINNDELWKKWFKNPLYPEPLNPLITPNPFPNPLQGLRLGVTREEFDQLKREVELLRDMLKAAKEYDEKTGQPDCEMDEKIKILKQVGEMLGVNLEEIFKPKK